MNSTTRRGIFSVAALLCPAWLSAQTTPVHTAGAPAGPSWSFVFTADGYLVPASPAYVSPTVTADRGWLPLEARYDYEDRKSGSVWFGYTFSVGQRPTVAVTPMVGGVVGTTAGVAPGYQATLTYRRLSVSDTGEYVFDVRDRSGSFFYAWPQVAYSLTDWLNVGVAAQRTKAY